MASTFTAWGFCLTMVQGAGQAISENKISDKIILPRQSPGLTRCLGCPWHHSLRNAFQDQHSRAQTIIRYFRLLILDVRSY
jgi:hypothetical protein